MKKLLLALIIAFTASSAIAKISPTPTLDLQEEETNMLYKENTQRLEALGIELNSSSSNFTPPDCKISGNCITCFEITYCILQ